MCYQYNFFEIQDAFLKFADKYSISEESKQQFFEEILPKIYLFAEKEIPLSFTFKKINEGMRKEVYIFSDFVIKITNKEEIEAEKKRKNSSNFQDSIFLDYFCINLPNKIINNYNSQLHLAYVDCIVLQKKIITFEKKILKDRAENKRLIINKNWLLKFIDLNYKESEKDLITKFLFELDISNNNIGYDENGNPILFDW